MPNRALEAALSRPVPEAKAELFRALAHPARIRVLEVLSDGEHSVGEMQPLVGIESSHLSQQLAVLRRAGSGDHAQGGLDRLLLAARARARRAPRRRRSAS